MEAESSQAVRRRGKRPARVGLPDDDDEEALPIANGRTKKRRSGPVEEDDSDLDILTDGEAGARLNGEEKVGKANGYGIHQEEDEHSELEDNEEDGPVRPIGFRPEYQRGADGWVSS